LNGDSNGGKTLLSNVGEAETEPTLRKHLQSVQDEAIDVNANRDSFFVAADLAQYAKKVE